MNECPHCGRRLLSKASSCCNWCGKEIESADYQVQAQAEREAFFAHQAQHDAQSLANIHAIDVYASDVYGGPTWPGGRGRVPDQARRVEQQAQTVAQKAQAAGTRAATPRTESGFPLRGGVAPQPSVPPARPPEPEDTPEAEEEMPETSGQRFRHLEL